MATSLGERKFKPVKLRSKKHLASVTLYLFGESYNKGHTIRGNFPKKGWNWCLLLQLFKEFDCNDFFHVPEDCQHGLLYWLLFPELFLYLSFSASSIHGLFFDSCSEWKKTLFCDNIPAGQSPLSQPPKPAHGHPIVKWFFSSPAWGISHWFTNTQVITYTTERGKKRKINKHGLGLAPGTRRERRLWHFSVVFWASVGYRERVSEWNSHTATWNDNSSSCVGLPGFWVHRSQLLT